MGRRVSCKGSAERGDGQPQPVHFCYTHIGVTLDVSTVPGRAVSIKKSSRRSCQENPSHQLNEIENMHSVRYRQGGRLVCSWKSEMGTSDGIHVAQPVSSQKLINRKF